MDRSTSCWIFLFIVGQDFIEYTAHMIEAGKELHKAVMPDIVQVGNADDLVLFLEYTFVHSGFSEDTNLQAV